MHSANRILLLFVALIAAISSTAQYVQPMRYPNYSIPEQVNIGSGVVRVTDPSAYLEIGPTSGGNKGLLPPRLTSTQRDAIASPTAGLMIYNTTSNQYNYYNGSSWATFSSGGSGSGISQLGNTGNLWLIRVNDSTYAFDTASANSFYRSLFVQTGGSYANPSWISSLAWSKITSTPTTLSGYGITDAVPSSRTITINGTTLDLSTNRSWTLSGGTTYKVGTFNGATPDGNGFAIVDDSIHMQVFGAEYPGLVPSGGNSTKVLYGDGMWKSPKQQNARDTLSGASPSWDFSTANFAMLSVTTDATVSVINSNDMDAGILRIIGNGTDSVILSGTAEDSLTISTCETCITEVAFLNHGGDIYWTLVGKYSGGAGGGGAPGDTGYLTFTDATDLTESSSHIFTSPGGGTAFGNLGLDTVSLAANQSGRIWFLYSGVNEQAVVLGFNTANAKTGYTGMEAGVFSGTSADLSKIDGGTATFGLFTLTAPTYIAVYRDGSTGTIKLQTSTDQVAWTDRATLTYTTTAQLYIVCDVQGNKTLNTPKWQKL